MMPSALQSCRYLAAVMLLSSSVSSAQQQALADDGRAVLLHNDGRWEYVSDDKLATRRDGTRIVLQANGQWQTADDTPLSASIAAFAKPAALRLVQGAMEFQKKKSGSKNTVLKSRTVLVLDTDHTLSITADSISVRDNKQNNYAVLSLQAENTSTASSQRWQLVVDGAPKWVASFGITQLTVTVRQTSAEAAPVVLNIAVDQLDTREVDNLF